MTSIPAALDWSQERTADAPNVDTPVYDLARRAEGECETGFELFLYKTAQRTYLQGF